MTVGRLCRAPEGAAALILALIAMSAAPVAAQRFTGMVAEQLSLAPARGAVVVLFRASSGSALETVGMTTTDEAGAFSIDAPGPGAYRVQADLDGLSSPLSPTVALMAPDAVGEVALLLPSILLRSAMTCLDDRGTTAAVVGTVRDPDADLPLPSATVVASWRVDGRGESLETISDAAGRYRLCPPSDAGLVSFRTRALGRSGEHPSVRVESATVVIHDLDLSLGGSDGRPRDVIRERVLTEAAAATLGDLGGTIRDSESDTPLPHVVVRLRGTRHQAVSDEGGRFSFTGLTPGSYNLEIRSLGYAVVSASIDVPAGQAVHLGLAVAPEAVELEGLEVTARSEVEQLTRITPFRRNAVYGESMAIEEQKGARAFEILRRTTPGLRVRELWRDYGPPILCVESNRRHQSLRPDLVDADAVADLLVGAGPLDILAEDAGCQNVQVVVDGVRIPDGPLYLQRTPATEIESIEFVPPVQAQILYGIGGETSNGVVVIHSRGNGPYASPLRNRAPGARR